jgi:hypothetical protein
MKKIAVVIILLFLFFAFGVNAITALRSEFMQPLPNSDRVIHDMKGLPGKILCPCDVYKGDDGHMWVKLYKVEYWVTEIENNAFVIMLNGMWKDDEVVRKDGCLILHDAGYQGIAIQSAHWVNNEFCQ